MHSCSEEAYTAADANQYDDLERGLVERPIGTYDNLSYQAWDVGNFVSAVIPVKVLGVATRSPPNFILTSSLTQLTGGTPSFTPAAPYTSLGLLDFYFGCVANAQQGTATAALQCTITVSGFAPKTNKEVAVASYTFTPPVQVSVSPVPMIHAVLPSSFWQGLGNVTIIQDNKLANLLVDNLHYSVTK